MLIAPNGHDFKPSSNIAKAGYIVMPDLSGKLVRWGRVAVGGPLGILAWCVSGASAVAIFLWGLNTVAIPLLMLKTASWGIWGFGVFRESRTRLHPLKKTPTASPPPTDPSA